MVDGGLTPLQGIVAATRGSATALGRGSELGTVTPGAVADLLVVDGDPLADVRVLNDPARVWLVMQEGTIVAGSRGRTASSTLGPAVA
jgi:imidazolonepropionase-like amidohydrolase